MKPDPHPELALPSAIADAQKVEGVRALDHDTELILRNVHIAASRAKRLLNGGKWCAVTKTLALLTHIQRFCEEAGYAPSVLRSNPGGNETDEFEPVTGEEANS